MSTFTTMLHSVQKRRKRRRGTRQLQRMMTMMLSSEIIQLNCHWRQHQLLKVCTTMKYPYHENHTKFHLLSRQVCWYFITKYLHVLVVLVISPLWFPEDLHGYNIDSLYITIVYIYSKICIVIKVKLYAILQENRTESLASHTILTNSAAFSPQTLFRAQH